MRVITFQSFALAARHIKSRQPYFLKSLSIRTMSTEKNNHLQRTANNKRHEIISAASVKRIKDESKTVKRLILKIDDKNFTFKPGQWVDMFIPNIEIVGGYSICSTPEQLSQNQVIELAVKYSEHPPACWIHTKCAEGSHVKLRVGGDFYFDAEVTANKPDLLLIAGGVGINPLFSMWRHARDLDIASNDYPDSFGKLMLLYSVSTHDELIFNNEIGDAERSSSNLHCQRFVTKESGTSLGIKYRRIGLEDITKAFHWLNQDVTKVYICGPSQMISDMENLLLSQNFPKDRIYVEKWW